MKKIILSITATLIFGLTYGQTLVPPIDFESTTITYSFTDFDGGGASVIANPQSSGINTSANVGQMIKAAGQVWGGSYLSMTNPLDFSVNRLFKVKVYSPRVGARLLLKVENGANGGIFYEVEDTSTVANAWEELEFDYAAVNTNNTYDNIVLIWDLGVMGDSSSNFTFLFDDIDLVLGSSGPPSNKSDMDLPITWNDTANVNYTTIDFGGNASMQAADPANSSNLVLQSIKTSGAQTWAGTSFGNNILTAIPFVSGSTTINAVVYSPTAGTPVRMKVEDATDPTKSVETEVITTIANGWDTLSFDFSVQAAGTAGINFGFTYDKISIFYNFGTQPTANETYYVDDVWFDGGTTPPPPSKTPISLPITWNDTANVNYTTIDFGGNVSMLSVDPSNSTNVVLQAVKTAGSQVWAGTSLGGNLSTAIPFATGMTSMTALVYSPTIGTPIRMKVEDKTDPGISVETEVNTTIANAWEAITFDFSVQVTGTAAINFANTYDKASIFFNFGTAPTTPETYYLDDVVFGQLTIGINQISVIDNLDVYPNPTAGVITFSSDHLLSDINAVEVFSATGQLVYNAISITNNSLDLSELDNGLYFIKITSDNNQIVSKVFISK